MWLAGLRGAMAYALALKSTFDFEKGPVMLITTLIYSFISILGVGSCMSPILEKLEVNKKRLSRRQSIKRITGLDIAESASKADPQLDYDQSRTRSEGGSYQTNNCCLRFKRSFSQFQQKSFAPLFIR